MKKIIFLIFLASIIFGQETKISNVDGSYVFVTDSKLSVKKLPTQLTANELLGDVFLRGTDNNEIRFTEKIEIKKKKHDLGLGPAELGGNVNPFTYPLAAMEARLHDGLKKMEFEFMGAGKGNKDSITPELLGKREREELKNLD